MRIDLPVRIHSLMQHADNLYPLCCRCAKEDDVTALWKFSIAWADCVDALGYIRGFCEAFKRIKKFPDIGVALIGSPHLHCVGSDVSEIRIRCGRNPVAFHWC